MIDKKNIAEILNISKIIPVVELLDEFDAVPLMEALIEGGVKVVEINIRTQAAFDSIEIIKRRLPYLIVGAANIKTPDMLQKTIDCGADYGTSPGNTDRLMDAVVKQSFPFLPGVSHASDIMRALEYGHNIQRLCPVVSLGGVKTLKYLNTSFSELIFSPAGGITDENVLEFLLLPNVCSVGGSWIVRSHDTYAKKWSKVIERTKFSFDNIAKAS